MTTESAAKRSTQKLQRAIVDGLEDVKAQDIQVFDTEHLSALFERVIVASGTSNRQTKALAASVCDTVRDAGFPKPRVEGEANGEWIIVDCSQAVVHIMQPAFRSYYHLEELWGEKPVRLKLGARKPVATGNTATGGNGAAARRAAAATPAPTRPAARSVAEPGAATPVAGKAAAGKRAAGKPVAGKSVAGKSVAARAAPAKGATARPRRAATAPRATVVVAAPRKPKTRVGGKAAPTSVAARRSSVRKA